jgi:hypothetical protein
MEHDFYHLDDAAGLLECKELDLLKWGMTGKIELCIWYHGQLDRTAIPDNAFTGRPAPAKDETVNEYLPILIRDIQRFIIPRESRSNGKIEIEQIMWPGCNYPLYLLEVDLLDDGCGNTQLIEIKKNDLVIMGKTFNTLKAELLKSPVELEPPPPFGNEIAAILDPGHPWHSELLAIAVKGWLELYSNRDGNSSDNAHKPTGGHIAMIEKWLSEKSAELSNNAIDYTAKVINPAKRGGPSKTQG